VQVALNLKSQPEVVEAKHEALVAPFTVTPKVTETAIYSHSPTTSHRENLKKIVPPRQGSE